MSFPTLGDQSTDELFASMEALGMGAGKRRKRFSSTDIALHTARHSQAQRFDTDFAGDVDLTTTPRTPRPRPLRELLDINSPPASPRKDPPALRIRGGGSGRDREAKKARKLLVCANFNG